MTQTDADRSMTREQFRALNRKNRPPTYGAPYTYKTVADVKRANAHTGCHFFDDDTLRFFRSRVGSELIAGHLFVTSERGPNDRRRYTLRDARPGGDIATVGDFQQYATQRAALAAAHKMPPPEAPATVALADAIREAQANGHDVSAADRGWPQPV